MFSSEEYLSISEFNVNIFFHCFVMCKTRNKRFFENYIVTFVTYDVLFIIFCHLIDKCISPYFVLSKVRKLSVGTL